MRKVLIFKYMTLQPHWFLNDGCELSHHMSDPCFMQVQCYKLGFTSWKHKSA
jgi:hypothetical protein